MTPQRLLVFGDVQYPFLDCRTDQVFRRFVEDFKPDQLVLNGDILDGRSIAKYTPDPKWLGKLEVDLTGCRNYLSSLIRLLPSTCQVMYNGGNHEDRLRKYLWAKAPELGDEVTIESVLHLADLGISYTPYYNPVNAAGAPGTDIGGLLIVHGWTARKWSGATARACYEQFGGSGITGHTHRLGAFYHRDYRGEYAWFEGGCMCELEPVYAPVPDWQQGFVAGYILDRGPGKPARFDVRQVPIIDHEFIWEGTVYRESTRS